MLLGLEELQPKKPPISVPKAPFFMRSRHPAPLCREIGLRLWLFSAACVLFRVSFYIMPAATEVDPFVARIPPPCDGYSSLLRDLPPFGLRFPASRRDPWE
jgi:hypothetical protein